MKKEDRNTFIIIAVVLIICIISLVVVFNIVWRIVKSPVKQSIDYVTAVVEGQPNTNYNFEVEDADDVEIEEEQEVQASTSSKQPEDNYIVGKLVQKAKDKSKFEQSILDNAAEDKIIASATGRKYYSTGGNYLIVSEGAEYNYNFYVPAAPPSKENIQELQSIPDAIITDAQLAGYGSSQDQNAGSAGFGIRIPKIGVDSPVVQGLGANDLLEQGFWVHPNSGQLGKGLVTMLCHRRYFGPYDPRSCWFLDRLEKGDEIQMGYEGKDLIYEVVGVNEYEGSNPLIYNFSETDDYIKIVTCTPLYSNQNRLVVLAKRIR